MKAFRRSRLCLVLLLANISASCGHTDVVRSDGAAPVRPDDYYPLAVGNCWTYTTSFQGQAQPDLKVCIVKEENGYFFDNRPVPSQLRFDAVGLRDGKIRYLLKAPLEEGAKWLSVTDVQTVEHYDIEAVGKKVNVPAGVYKDCLVIRMEIRMTDNRSMINRMTFAPGVGIVEIRTSFKAGAKQLPQSIMQLKKYEAGPGSAIKPSRKGG